MKPPLFPYPFWLRLFHFRCFLLLLLLLSLSHSGLCSSGFLPSVPTA